VISEFAISILCLVLVILSSWRIPFLIKLLTTPKFLMDLKHIPKIKYPLQAVGVIFFGFQCWLFDVIFLPIILISAVLNPILFYKFMT